MSSHLDQSSMFENPYSFIISLFAIVAELLFTFVFWKVARQKQELPVISNLGEFSVPSSYKYLVRIRTGNCTVNFDHQTTKIILNFLNKNRKRIESLTIPPDTISRYGKRDYQSNIAEMRMVNLYWIVSDLLPPFNYIQLTHNCRVPHSTITVYDVDIREPYSSLAAKAIVNSSIDCVIDPNAIQQTYPVENLSSPSKDDVHSPLNDCSFLNRLVSNWHFAAIHLLVSSFFPYSGQEIIAGAFSAVVNGIVGAAISHIATFAYLAIFLAMRATFSPYFGHEFNYFEIFWMLTSTIFALAVAVLAVLFGSQFETDYPENWVYAVVTLFFYRLVVFEISVIYLLKFLRSLRMRVRDDNSFFARNSETDEKPALPVPRSPSAISIQSTGSTYFNQLLKDNNIARVKSISQYGALLAQQEPPK